MLFSLFLFALKSSLVLCILYGAYHFLFRNNTNFHTKRALMLLVLVAALLLPLIEYRTSNELAPENPSLELVDELETGKLEKQVLTKKSLEGGVPIETNLADIKGFDWLTALTYAYGLGVLIMLALFLVELARITWILQKASARNDLDRVAITHKLVRFPFSFWRWIFLPANLDYNSHTWKLIQQHEKVHLQEGHTIDVLFISLIKSILWFNPVIHWLQKSMKDNHEALADRSVLKEHNLSDYSKALLEVCLQTGSLNLGHSFALKSNLAKRLNNMDMKPTHGFRTMLSLILFLAVGFGVFTQTSMYGQNYYQRKVTQDDLDSRKIVVPYGALVLAPKYEHVMQKLKDMNPENEYRFHYLAENQLFSYAEKETPRVKTEFFAHVSAKDKKAIYEKVLSDTTERRVLLHSQDLKEETVNELIWQYIEDYQNYITIYQWLPYDQAIVDLPIYEMDEVDILPEPLGGLENFERTVALDVALPNDIDKSDLPENIEFSFVVEGANKISHIDLITELRGSRNKSDKIYKSFRLIHDSILDKIRSYYSWKRGIKDGEKVNVRMVVSIPTKYL